MANTDDFDKILRSVKEAVEPFSKLYDFRIEPSQSYGGSIEVRIEPKNDNPRIQIIPGAEVPVKMYFGPICGWYDWKSAQDFTDKIYILSMIAHRAEDVCEEICNA